MECEKLRTFVFSVTTALYKGLCISNDVYIDGKAGTITYTYISDMLNNTVKKQWLATFNFQRKDNKTPAEKMIGFSSDIFPGKKIKSFEWKIDKQGSNMDNSYTASFIILHSSKFDTHKQRKGRNEKLFRLTIN